MVDFWWNYAWPGLWIVIQILFLVVPLLIVVAYLTYAERKVIGFMQLRMGPNVVGPFGLLQPFADALKLMTKELIIPTGANRVVFLMAPMLTFVLAMVGFPPRSRRSLFLTLGVFCMSSRRVVMARTSISS